MISTFSSNIVSLLNNPQSIIQLSNPSALFLKMIPRKFTPEQIVSLQLNADRFRSKIDLSIFRNLISLTLHNL